jgi:hypothetical protein
VRINNVIVDIKPTLTGNGLDVKIYGVPKSALDELQRYYGNVDTFIDDVYIEFYTKVQIYQLKGGQPSNKEVNCAIQ